MDIIFLAEFPVLRPDPGLIVWTGLVFIIVYFFLGRFAFRPIQNALKDREKNIQEALDEAKKAKEEMSALQAKNKELLAQAQEERAKILQEAKEAKNAIVSEAKNQAREEASKIISNARQEIENQKRAAIEEIKGEVGSMALQVAEKVLRKELQGDSAQQKFAQQLVDEIKLN